MQISPPALAVVPSLSGKPPGSDSRGKGALGELANVPVPRNSTPAPEPVKSEAADSVSISSEAPVPEAGYSPTPVYAEIWKGAIKVAQVDVNGHVVSYSGLVATGGGGGSAGPLLAAQRAVQVARQVGGEIRAAGQALDSQTLLMRARLASTYTV